MRDGGRSETISDGETKRADADELHQYVLWCCTIKVDIENSKGQYQYIEKDKQEATKDGSKSTKIQHGI